MHVCILHTSIHMYLHLCIHKCTCVTLCTPYRYDTYNSDDRAYSIPCGRAYVPSGTTTEGIIACTSAGKCISRVTRSFTCRMSCLLDPTLWRTRACVHVNMYYACVCVVLYVSAMSEGTSVCVCVCARTH